MNDSSAVKELEKVVEVLANASSRRKFVEDAEGTLAKAGVNLDLLPADVVHALGEMTPAELRLVSHLNATLVGAGLQAPDSNTVGIV